jgi:hypothetical protein
VQDRGNSDTHAFVDSKACGLIEIPSIVTQYDECSCNCTIVGDLLLTTLNVDCNVIEMNPSPKLHVIIDSGASAHMFPNADLLFDISSVTGWVSLGDSSKKCKIVGVGLTAIDVLGEVYYVPDISFGLISIPTLDKVGCRTEMGNGIVSIYMGSDIVMSGHLYKNLYHLDEKYIDILHNMLSINHHTSLARKCDDNLWWDCNYITNIDLDEKEICETANNAKGSTPGRLKSTTVGLSPLQVLHRRWGHLSEYNIKKALKLGMVDGAKYTYDDIKSSTLPVCFDCLRGRMKAFVNKPSDESDKVYKPFEKIACDYKGSFPNLSVHGNNGFYLIVDAGTKYVYAFCCKSKDEDVLHEVLNEYIDTIVTPNNYLVKKLQFDFDTVVMSDKTRLWLRGKSIKLQTSAPYTHAQNGLIERAVQNVLDRARTLMSTHNVPNKYWEYAVRIACYLINRSPTSKSTMTPLESAFGEKPDIGAFIPFYSIGMYHLTKEERKGKTFPYKAQKCRMLGYDEQCKNTLIILTVPNGKIISRKDCIFDERLRTEFTFDDVRDELENDDIDHIDFDSDINDNSDVRTDKIITDTIEQSDKMKQYPNEYPYFPASEEVYNMCNNNYNADIALLPDNWLNELVAAYNIPDIIKLPPDPKSIEEAENDPVYGEGWKKEIYRELNNFDIRDVFGEAPQTGHAMKTKLILKYSYNNDYTLKLKARLVACGYSQRYGIDYKETYAPTASCVAVFLIFQVGTALNCNFAMFDVSAAFLEGKNDFKNFARLPPKMIPGPDGKGLRVEVVGNFYGEKQGPKIWNDQLDSILTELGFDRCPAHPCVYRYSIDDKFIVLAVHVDDGLMCSNDDELFDKFIVEFCLHVKKATLSKEFKRFLGMDVEFDHTNNRVKLSHSIYILERYAEFKKVKSTPMSSTVNLRDAEPNPDGGSLLPDTGAFRFIADRARPDILVATGEIATGGAKDASDLHVKTSERVKHYLNSTHDLSLKLGGLGKFCIFAYSDASYITTGNCKSRLGGCVFMNYESGAIRTFSRNSTTAGTTLSHSSTESEIKAIDEVIRELMHIMDIVRFMAGKYDEPIIIYVDNKSAITLMETLKTNNRVKHINLRINFIREMIKCRFIELHFVPTAYNVADVLTKPLDVATFIRLRDIMMNGHGGKAPCFSDNVHDCLNVNVLMALDLLSDIDM